MYICVYVWKVGACIYTQVPEDARGIRSRRPHPLPAPPPELELECWWAGNGAQVLFENSMCY